MSTAKQLEEALGTAFDPKLGKASARLSLGRLDPRSGYSRHDVDLEMTLRWGVVEFSFGQANYLHPEFSIIGLVINRRKHDPDAAIEAAGQVQSTIDGHVSDPRWTTIKRLWDVHHLNAMHAECPHMRALGWLPSRSEPLPSVEHQGATRFVGHVREDEHPDGILGKRCPECGHAYGSKWLYEPIPPDDLQQIVDIMKETQK